MIVDPVDCVGYIAANIKKDLPTGIIEEAKTRILEGEKMGKSPWTIACASIYATSMETDVDMRLTQSDISEAGDTCEVSIRKYYEDYLTNKKESYS
jgi:transcription initiation factor TFIIIB Brf1 subunit/transcription initiation factor TFIIB